MSPKTPTLQILELHYNKTWLSTFLQGLISLHDIKFWNYHSSISSAPLIKSNTIRLHFFWVHNVPGIVTSILQALFHYSSHHHHSSHPTCRNISFLFIVFMRPFLCSVRSQHPLPFSSCYSFSPSLPEFLEDCSSEDVCSSSLPILVTDYRTMACAPTTHTQAPLHPLI